MPTELEIEKMNWFIETDGEFVGIKLSWHLTWSKYMVMDVLLISDGS